MVYDRCCYFLQCVLDQEKKSSGKEEKRVKTRKQGREQQKSQNTVRACACVFACVWVFCKSLAFAHSSAGYLHTTHFLETDIRRKTNPLFLRFL